MSIIIENGSIRFTSNDHFGNPVKIKNVTKVMITGNRVIEFYTHYCDFPNSICIYDEDETGCLDDYRFVKSYMEKLYNVKYFSKRDCDGFVVTSRKEEDVIYPEPMIVEGFIERKELKEEYEYKRYQDPIKVKDIIGVEKVSPRIIEIILESQDRVYWVYMDKNITDKKYKKIIDKLDERKKV